VITQERLKEVLHYDPVAGVWTWLKPPSRGKAKPGAEAGYRWKGLYRVIKVDGQKFYGHQLAVLYVTGVFPIEKVDHHNGVPGDDWWDNLRPATSRQNAYNRKLDKRSSTGVSGVRVDKPSGRYRASLKTPTGVKHLGMFATLDAARIVREAAARELHGVLQ
jgi:hypothetical protein